MGVLDEIRKGTRILNSSGLYNDLKHVATYIGEFYIKICDSHFNRIRVDPGKEKLKIK